MEDTPVLAAGVTDAHLDPAVAAAWVAAVHHAIREDGAQVTGPVVPPGPGRNYYMIPARLSDGSLLRLVLNVTARLVAAVDDDDPHAVAAPFRDVPRPDLFALAGLRAAAPVDMEAALTDDQIADLYPAERRDIAYHRPARVGDVIFNWFD